MARECPSLHLACSFSLIFLNSAMRANSGVIERVVNIQVHSGRRPQDSSRWRQSRVVRALWPRTLFESQLGGGRVAWMGTVRRDARFDLAGRATSSSCSEVSDENGQDCLAARRDP